MAKYWKNNIAVWSHWLGATKTVQAVGGGSGDVYVVSVLALYSDDPSWNPAEVCDFSQK